MAPALPSILVVEDDADLREVLTEVLAAEGYPVVGTANGAEALEWLATGARPALLLLDFWMPRMNGWEFLEHFLARPEHGDVPVVALTTSPERHPAVRTTLRKPFEMVELVSTVRGLLPMR